MAILRPKQYLDYGDIQVTPLAGRKYILGRSVSITKTEGSIEGSVIIPLGYTTNGASIPRIFWSIIEPNQSDILPAVILHDFLCDNAAKDRTDLEVSFKEADTRFRNNLIFLNQPKWKVKLMYAGVRLYHYIKYEIKWLKKKS